MNDMSLVLKSTIDTEKTLNNLAMTTEKRLNDIINAQFVALRNWNDEFQTVRFCNFL